MFLFLVLQPELEIKLLLIVRHLVKRVTNCYESKVIVQSEVSVY